MALVPDQKFSTFQDGGDLSVGDIVVGLRGGLNTKFTYAGIPSGVVVPISHGGTGATNASGARTNLGLGSIAVQDANAVSITGGNLDGVAITASTAALTSGSVAATPSAGTDIANKDYVDSIVSAAGAAGTIARSDGSVYKPSTATFADTYAASSLLYSNGANSVEGLATANGAVLLTNNSGVPAWSATLTNGQLIIGNTGNTPSVATLTAGAGISIVNGAGTITISSTGGGYNWTEVTGTSQAMSVNSGYIANNAGLVTLTLPATANVGDTIIVQGKGSGGWRIAQNAGQTIHFGTSDTTIGTGGYLESTNRYDSIELICITADTDFAVLTGVQGVLTVV